MKNRVKSILSIILGFMMVLSVSINAFAAEEQPEDSRFLPQVTYVEDNQIARVPNGIPITVNPYYNKLVVHVGNIGVDSLDSVTVSGSATDYGTLTPKTHSVPPVIGKDFTWYIPQTKCHMEYDVNIHIVVALEMKPDMLSWIILIKNLLVLVGEQVVLAQGRLRLIIILVSTIVKWVQAICMIT